MNTHQNEIKKQWLGDLNSGIVISLLALPLSIGIAIASGAPASSGIISAIMGGIVGSIFTGSYVTINGPAAGLIVVVLSGIQTLGDGDPHIGFRRMLAALIIAGSLQILTGILKLGKWGALFPLSVTRGMLTSIGIIVILKQLYPFMGHKSMGTIADSITHLPNSIMHMNPEPALVGLIGLLMVILLPKIKSRLTQSIPAPLIAIVFSSFLANQIGSTEKIKVPLQLNEFLITPLFDQILSHQSILTVFTIFLIASIESLLSASAIEKMDPLKRKTDYNKELIGKGIVNVSCGLIGGLPVIAEAVRSSANISHGAKSQKSNFFHSLFILVSIIAIPKWINLIPLSALAGLLIIVGYRMVNIKQLQKLLHTGMIPTIAFGTTVTLTLSFDLLVGVVAGTAVKFILAYLFFNPKRRNQILTEKITFLGEKAIIEFHGSLSFFSKIDSTEKFNNISDFKQIEINLEKLTYIDPSALDRIIQLKNSITATGKIVDLKLPKHFARLQEFLYEH